MSKHRLPAFACPDCQRPAAIRSSEQLSDLAREIRYKCENDDCGHIFVAQLSVLYTVRPSDSPRAGVHIPLSRAPQAHLAIGRAGVPPIAANDQVEAVAG